MHVHLTCLINSSSQSENLFPEFLIDQYYSNFTFDTFRYNHGNNKIKYCCSLTVAMVNVRMRSIPQSDGRGLVTKGTSAVCFEDGFGKQSPL